MELGDFQGRYVDAMVHYFYHLDYDYPSYVWLGNEPIEFDLGVSVIAERYAIKGLVQQSANRVRDQIMGACESLKLDAIVKAWDMKGTPNELKDYIVQIAANNIALFHTEACRELLDRSPDLAVRMVKSQAELEMEMQGGEKAYFQWEWGQDKDDDGVSSAGVDHEGQGGDDTESEGGWGIK